MGGKISQYCTPSGALTEVIFFLYKTGESLLDTTIRPYIVETVCSQTYKDNLTVCTYLHELPDEQNSVQMTAARYIMYHRMLANIPAIVLGLFCGAWSDKYGRKIPIVMPSLGSVLSVLLYMVSLVSGPSALGLILAGATLQGIFGKSSVITMAVNSYISDNSEKSDRTRKLGKMQAMNFFGLFVGSLMSGTVLHTSTVQTGFCIVVFIHGLCIIFTVMCLNESPRFTTEKQQHPDDLASMNDKSLASPSSPSHSTSESSSEFFAIFKPSNVRDCLAVLTRSRKTIGRHIIIALLITSILNQTCKSGELDVMVLFVDRRPLNWPTSWYGFVLAFDYALMGLSLFFVLPLLTNLFKISDMAIIMIAIGSRIARLLLMAFASSTWMVYLAVVIGLIGGLIVSAIRSLLSKTVDDDELGKMFSILACGETMSKLLGTVIFTTIYSATAFFLPGFVFIIGALIYIGLFFLMIWLYKEVHISGTYNLLNSMVKRKRGASPEDPDEVDELTELNHAQAGKKTVRFYQQTPLLCASTSDIGDYHNATREYDNEASNPHVDTSDHYSDINDDHGDPSTHHRDISDHHDDVSDNHIDISEDILEYNNETADGHNDTDKHHID